MKWFSLSLLALLACNAAATHPVVRNIQHDADDLAERQRFLTDSKRKLSACSNSDAGRKLLEQSALRRADKIQQLRAARRLDATTALATSHLSTALDGVKTYPGYLFDDVKCVLAPETTQETYYVTGELYATDLTGSQAGINLTTELQFIDVSSCTPVSNLFIDFWHANAAGLYSGVVGSGAGETTDTSNADATFLRGLVMTDLSGLVVFNSIFPGAYSGRAPHIDVLANYNGTFENNRSYSGGSVVHAGEIFFDQDLVDNVVATSSYSSDNVTTNAEDAGLTEAAENDYDPIVEYALLGDSVADGIFAWISIGVDLTADHDSKAAAAYTADGGGQIRV